MNLLIAALAKFLLGAMLTGALIFVPAGSLAYGNGWLLMALVFLPMLAAGLVMWKKAPRLLEKRLKGRETQAGQRLVVALSGLIFVAGFVAAGLDFRLGWSQVPRWLTALAAALLLAAYALYGQVMRENAYLSRTVEVQQGQKVIDTGLYGLVRHPMYTATLALFLTMPLVLGSYVALIPFLAYPFVIVRRIRGEEALLESGLPGYADYKRRVKYRLIPHIW